MTYDLSLIRNNRLPKRPRRRPKRLAERHAEPCRVRETAGQCDFRDRQLALAQKLAPALQPYSADFLRRRSAQIRTKLNLEAPPRNRHLAQNILHDNSMMSMRANIAKCPNDRRVVDRKHVRRLPADDPMRRDEHRLFRRI